MKKEVRYTPAHIKEINFAALSFFPKKEVGGFVVMKLLMPFETIWKQTDLDDCANAFVNLAKNSSMTGQSVQIGEWDFFFCYVCIVRCHLKG